VAFKFVHTADIHLDSPLKSLALRDAGLAELVGNASRATFSRIVDLCLSEEVQALLIAGDLYDSGQTSMKTARFLAQEMERLASAGTCAGEVARLRAAQRDLAEDLCARMRCSTVDEARARLDGVDADALAARAEIRT